MNKTLGIWGYGGVGVALLVLLTGFGCLPAHYPALPPPPPPAPPKAEAPPPKPVMYVGVGRLNLRAGPGLDFPIIVPLERNEELERVGETAEWSQVRVKRTGAMGWVATKYLSAKPTTAPPAAPPVATPPVAPPAAPEPAPPPATAKPAEKPKPAKPAETAIPRGPKPAEAKEPPPSRKPAEKPAQAEEKPKPPVREEPPAKPAEPPPEKPSGIRLM